MNSTLQTVADTDSASPTSTTKAIDDANTTSTSTQQNTIQLLDLAAACVACTAEATLAMHALLEKKNTRTKPDGSFVTDADLIAQGIIVQAVQALHPDIDILGEESADEMRQHMQLHRSTSSSGDADEDHRTKNVSSSSLLRTLTQHEIRLRYHKRTIDPMPLSPAYTTSTSAEDNNNADITDMDDPEPIAVSRIRIVVDPLDGTKSYTTGEYEAVSILIAILVDAEPLFGVIGKPFGYGGTEYATLHNTPCVTFYGGPLVHGMYVAGAVEPIRPTLSSSASPSATPAAVISSSRSTGVVQDFCRHLANDHGLIQPEPLLISGAGEKSLRCCLQRNHAALWFFPKGGTSLWDVAAPDALLRALGGKLTNKYGALMDYTKRREQAENVEGVVACIDPDLHAKCIALFQEGDWLGRI